MYEKLDKENILKYLSQEEILERYLGIRVSYNKKHCNPFRDDKHPDCMFRRGSKYVFFTDYARPEYGGDCFKVCALYYGLNLPRDFYEVCRHINQDFQLGLSDGSQLNYTPIQREEILSVIRTEEETYSDIRVRVRPFSDYDLAFWAKIGITQDILEMDDFKTFRADSVWINGTLFYHYQEKDLCFVYFFKETGTFKIYKPNGKSDKWRGNSLDIDGYMNLPETGDVLFITKSRKDRMVLHKLGYLSIAPQAEGHPIPEDIIIDLKKRFKRIIVFYDNDEPGVKSSIRITELYDLEYFNIPKQFNVKDPSDFVEMYEEEVILNLLKQKLDG